MIMLAAGFGQMALAAALLHVNIIAANPITVVAGIIRIGWAYLWPCLLAGISLAFTVLGVVGLLYKMPRMWMEALALWGYWVLVLYLGMVSIRMMGLTYHAARPRPGVVPAPAAVGDFAASWQALREFVSLTITPEPSSLAIYRLDDWRVGTANQDWLGAPWRASSKRSMGQAPTNLSRAIRDPDASIEIATRRHSAGVVGSDPAASVSEMGSSSGSGASVMTAAPPPLMLINLPGAVCSTVRSIQCSVARVARSRVALPEPMLFVAFEYFAERQPGHELQPHDVLAGGLGGNHDDSGFQAL